MGSGKRYTEQVQSFKYDNEPKNRKSDTLRVYKEGNKTTLYSYSTPIAFKDDKGNVYATKRKYSNTTSSQQSIIRRELSPKELEGEEFEKKYKETN